jgi:multisubunit Na+/H+ antiporter MnhF subunit
MRYNHANDAIMRHCWEENLRLPTEANLRVAVGIGLWCVSGSILVAFFQVIAGPDLWARLTGVVWAIVLMVGMILVWRLPDWRRYLAVILEVVVLTAGVGMVKLKVDEAQSASSQSILAGVKASADYLETSAQLQHEQALQSALITRLAQLPADYTTAAREATGAIRESQARAGLLSKKLVDMENIQGSSNGPTIFELFGEPNAPIVESLALSFLAIATELLALVLTRSGIEVAHVRDAGVSPQPNGSAEEQAYLRVRAELISQNRDHGYRNISKELQISPSRGRQIMERLKARTSRGA